MSDLFHHRPLLHPLLEGRQKENDKGGSDTSEGQVDVETPSPGEFDVVGECTAHQWSCNARNAIHCANNPSVCGSSMQRNGFGDDQNGAGEDACRSQTSNRTADDERSRIRRDSADQGTDFENTQRGHVNPFYGVKGVELAENELECASGEEVCASIPTDVVEGVELIGDSRNGSCDDGIVLLLN